MLGAGAFTENFRSALNGFNRTDVVQFIQRQTVEHEKAMRHLREENARLKQAATEPTGDSGAFQAANAALESQVEDLTNRLNAATQQYTALMAENEKLKAALTAANAELDATKKELETAKEADSVTSPSLDRPIAPPTGMATAPGSFDELELAAYRRAEQTERMARERAAASSERIRGIYHQAESKMNLTASDMAVLMDNLRNNCDQMQALMETARNILAESAEGLKASADLSSVV